MRVQPRHIEDIAVFGVSAELELVGDEVRCPAERRRYPSLPPHVPCSSLRGSGGATSRPRGGPAAVGGGPLGGKRAGRGARPREAAGQGGGGGGGRRRAVAGAVCRGAARGGTAPRGAAPACAARPPCHGAPRHLGASAPRCRAPCVRVHRRPRAARAAVRRAGAAAAGARAQGCRRGPLRLLARGRAAGRGQLGIDLSQRTH